MRRPLDSMSKNEILDSFDNKNKISSVDVWNLSAAISPTKLKKYIDIDSSEEKEIRTIEMDNIGRFIAISMTVLKKEDPLSLVPYNIKAEIEEIIEEEATNKRIEKALSYTMTMRYILTNGTFKNFDPIKGKIPKKGLFSMRQSKADEWYADYLKSQITGLSFVLRKENSTMKMGIQFIIWNAVFYLEKAYPKKFKQTESSINDHVYYIMKQLIPNFPKNEMKEFDDLKDLLYN